MGWEWRYFVRTSSPDVDALPLAGCREDVYFPVSNAVGAKLRNGQGGLEIKLRTEVSNAEARLSSTAEFWVKSIHSGCVVGGALVLPRSLRRPAEDLLACSAGEPLPLRILCRKSRKQTSCGGASMEDTDCVFVAMVTGHSRPVLVERYQSISIESHSLSRVAAAVSARGALPVGAIVGGYPSLVQDIALRAMQVAKGEESSVQPTCDEAARIPYEVLETGDVRSMPRSDAGAVGRLNKGERLYAVQEEVDASGRHWLLVCQPPSSSERWGWTAMTKKNGKTKFAAL